VNVIRNRRRLVRAERIRSGRPDAKAPRIVSPSFALITLALESCAAFSIVATDVGGEITLWSEGARRLYGFDRAEVVGQQLGVLHAEADHAARTAEMFNTARRLGSWEGPVKRVRRDGTRFTARVSVTPVLDTDGDPEGYLFASSDASDETMLRRELEDERRYERSLFEASADAMGDRRRGRHHPTRERSDCENLRL
jgi:PAS domain S-box-containing protein